MEATWKGVVLLVTVIGLLGVGTVLAADSFVIGRSVIAGGGQEATGGDFILNGTIAEPIVGTLSLGATHGLSSGFWWPREYRVFLPLVVRY